jgi:hypothetical protein
MWNRSTRRYMKACSGLPAAILCMTLLLLTGARTVSAQSGPGIGPSEVGGHVVQGADHGPACATLRRAGKTPDESSGPAPKAESWIVRHPVITGTLIGTGVGLALSRVDAIGGANHDPRVGLIGAGAGAWGGLVASAVRKARAKEKVGIGTKIGIAAGAVGIIVLPVLACYGAGGCGGAS